MMYHYQKNIGDYRSATMHLSLLEHGVYNQLLDWYYLDERPLPTDNRTLFRRLSARTEAEQQAVLDVLSEMFTQTESGWTHKRVEREISQYKAKAQQAREAGKLGGRPSKKGFGSENNRDGFLKEPDAKPTANQEPLTKNQEPKEDTSSENSVGAAEAASTKPEAAGCVFHTSSGAGINQASKTSQSAFQAPPQAIYDAVNGEDRTRATSKRGHRLPEGWQLPRPWGEWALAEYSAWTPAIVRLEAAKFADHWHAKAGKDASKTDWEATWRNWCRSLICQEAHTGRPTFAQQAADVTRTTVPAKPGKDPTLLQIEADMAKAVPPSLEVLERLAKLRAAA